MLESFLKAGLIYLPAGLFWVLLFWGSPFIELRTEEEVEDEERETRRLERFYEVDDLTEDDEEE